MIFAIAFLLYPFMPRIIASIVFGSKDFVSSVYIVDSLKLKQFVKHPIFIIS